MHFASPIWLLGLLPWAAVAMWLFSGSRERAAVPFLALWRGPVAGPRTKRRLHTPPLPFAFALLAMLLAIVAAAHLQLPIRRTGFRGALTIIVDRGITMSARGAKDLRYREVAGEASAALREHLADCTVQFLAVPGDSPQTLDLDRFLERMRELPPTALDTREMLAWAIAQAKAPVLLISDQTVPASRPVIQAGPTTPVRDVGIIAMAARQRPVPQVMVRVRNQSNQTNSVLRVSSGGQSVERRIDLPSRPGERNYFIDLPRIAATVSAELAVNDDLPANDRAWLVSEGTSPRIEPRFPLPPELRRLIDVYGHSRPADGRSIALPIVRDASELPKDAPGVVIATARETLLRLETEAADHAVTRHVHWRGIHAPLRVARMPPAGWMPLVRDGENLLVAVKPTPPNQIWIGFDSAPWAASTDYVIFWTNVFDWTGGGGESMAAHSLNDWGPEWEVLQPNSSGMLPGLYHRADGVLRAFNAPDVPVPAPLQTQWRSQIAALAFEAASFDSAPWLLLVALACLVFAAASWKRSQ